MTDVDDFTAQRAAWKAAGCPADHPYMVRARTALAEPRKPVEPLLNGWTLDTVRQAAALTPASVLPW